MAVISTKAEVSGFVKSIEVLKGGAVVRRLGGFENLITDSGLQQMGASKSIINFLCVGGGSSTPTPSDTQLDSQIAQVATNNIAFGRTYNEEEGWVGGVLTWTFPVGAVVGNVTELGTKGDAGGSLFSRALVKDGNGNPTSVTVLSDEQLRVSWEFRKYWPKVDAVTTVVNEANPLDVYQFTVRALDVRVWNWGRNSSAGFYYPLVFSSSYDPPPLSGAGYGRGCLMKAPFQLLPLDRVPQQLSGVAGANANRVSNGVGYILHTAKNGANDANAGAEGIGGGVICYGNASSQNIPSATIFQFTVDPPIFKTSNDKLDLTFRLEWGRR